MNFSSSSFNFSCFWFILKFVIILIGPKPWSGMDSNSGIVTKPGNVVYLVVDGAHNKIYNEIVLFFKNNK